jgi:hypothetical protein
MYIYRGTLWHGTYWSSTFESLPWQQRSMRATLSWPWRHRGRSSRVQISSRLFWQVISWLFSLTPGKFRDSTLNQATAISLHIQSDSLFINHPFNQCDVFWATDSILSTLTNHSTHFQLCAFDVGHLCCITFGKNPGENASWEMCDAFCIVT